MKVTFIKKIFLHGVELDIPECPTQEVVNKAVEEYLKIKEINDPLGVDWDDTDYFGNKRIEVFDNYSGVEIYNSMEQ